MTDRIPSTTDLVVDARVDARNVEVAFTIRPGETVAILGPNGAGKSTVLGLLAGLIRADSGHATLGERTVFDQSTSLAPHRRGVALLAQDALLFPHLSVLDNVAFGPRSAGASRTASRATARDWLDRVDAASLAARPPGALSGGQAQRVAVARALAADPELLLLDEPLAALDVSVAGSIRRLLRTVLADRTTILVTHDIVDALTLADRVFVMEAGRIVEQGTPRDVIERPRSRFAARLAGLNFFTGPRIGDTLHADTGDWMLPLRPDAAPPSTATPHRWVAVVPPAAVRVTAPRGADDHGARRILDLEPRGDVLRVRAKDTTSDISSVEWIDLGLEVGDEAIFTIDAKDITAYPA